jgi:polyhydroxyalkanoate synthesis regulator phasin
MSNEKIADFIDDLAANNMNQAKNTFNELIQDRLSIAIDQEKVKIANTVYNQAPTTEVEASVDDTNV